MIRERYEGFGTMGYPCAPHVAQRLRDKAAELDRDSKRAAWHAKELRELAVSIERHGVACNLLTEGG